MTKKTKQIGISVAAVVLVAAVICGIPAIKELISGSNPIEYKDLVAVLADYPSAIGDGMTAKEFLNKYYQGKLKEYQEWRNAHVAQVANSRDIQGNLSAYYSSIMKQMLVLGTDNTVCSPLNIFIACSMLAEIADGNTRQQILETLGAADLAELRNINACLWSSNYCDTPILKSTLANSLWISNNYSFNEDTLKNLAAKYYASSFRGTPGSEEMNKALRKWTDDNTGGLLSEYTKDMEISKDTILELVSTLYFKAMWNESFVEDLTSKQTFHGSKGDKKVDMMHKQDPMGLYSGSNFTAISMGLRDSGSVYFLLPDEGVGVNELVQSTQLMDLVQGKTTENWSHPEVHLSLPKFKVSAKVDLIETLQALGITDAVNPAKADFSPLTVGSNSIVLDKAEHAAMVEVDEQGIKGAAYTEMGMKETAIEPGDIVSLVFDRPFMFIVCGADGSILFSGVVRNID